jgi:hypothetical protein
MEQPDVFTPLEEAIAEISRRRKNPALVAAVREYLHDDIPPHFSQDKPILYLCRHIATPNYEALRFIEIGRSTDLPLVIGEDHKGIFVGNNRLKRALGKLPIVRGITRHRDEIIEYSTIVDFSTFQGSPLREVKTLTGTPLIEFHHALFKEIYPTGFITTDESNWIDRNYRDNLLEQYKRTLALLVVNGIMLESYAPDEQRLVESVLVPAFTQITKDLGVHPLISELITQKLEEERDWNAYPGVLYKTIQQHFQNHRDFQLRSKQVIS